MKCFIWLGPGTGRKDYIEFLRMTHIIYLMPKKQQIFRKHLHGRGMHSTKAFWLFYLNVFIYLGFNIAFNTVQVILQKIVLWAEET